MRQERDQRAYRALFADSVAFRRDRTSTPQLPPQARPAAASEPSPPTSPTKTTTVPRAGWHRLLEGTVAETVLTNRLDGGFAGPVNCLVTTPVYDRDGEKVLIPAGARFLGEVKPVNALNQTRLAVAFHRLVLPNGQTYRLDQFPGLDQIGDTALRDQVNHHYWQAFGTSAAVGALAGLTLSQARYGLDITGADAYRQGVTTSLGQSSERLVERYLNQLPTITIREGHRVRVYLTADLDLPPYSEQAPTAPAVSTQER
jgi:type IV secretory pathway VirB10-like protein